MIEVGRVLGARGLKGEIRLRLYRAEPELLELGKLSLALEGGEPRTFELAAARWTDRLTAVVRLPGIDDRDEAERWIGAAASVDPSWVPAEAAMPAALLIGAHAVVDDGGAAIGAVEDLFDNGAQMVLVVRTEDGREVMIPYVDALIAGVERGAGPPVVRVRAIPGLLE